MTEDRIPESRQEIEARIVTRAWEDEEFAQALRDDPVAAIEGELGLKMTDGLRVEVHEESREDPVWHLVIPPQPGANDAELTREELDAVAGGIRMISSYNLSMVTSFRSFIALDPGLGP